jgi:hypothetical protein
MTLLIAAFYGEIPAHIRMTFGMDKPECPYEVIREGEKLPDTWEQALIVHSSHPYDREQSVYLQEQLKALNPAGLIFVLPVEIEARDYTAELKSAIDVASKQYHRGPYIP